MIRDRLGMPIALGDTVVTLNFELSVVLSVSEKCNPGICIRVEGKEVWEEAGSLTSIAPIPLRSGVCKQAFMTDYNGTPLRVGSAILIRQYIEGAFPYGPFRPRVGVATVAALSIETGRICTADNAVYALCDVLCIDERVKYIQEEYPELCF